MGVATVTERYDDPHLGLERVRLTTGATTDTYQSKQFSSITEAFAVNESDDDGVGVAVSSQTVTLTVGTAGDVVDLILAGKK